jgi:uncharacterized protein (TIGR00369 family)
MTEKLSIETHQNISRELCGAPVHLAEGEAHVSLETTPAMSVDPSGLVHGGFIFGLADYAAMLAVNHPYVVLAGSSCQFIKPVRAGEHVTAQARITEDSGRKKTVRVTVSRDDTKVFSGDFTCVILEKHVLS